MFIDPYGRDVGFGSAEGAVWLQYVRFVRIGASVAIPSFVGFAVEQEVAQYSAGAPEEAVRPSLDAAFILVKYKNGARRDHLALRIDEATGNPRNKASPSSLEDEKSVAGGFDPA